MDWMRWTMVGAVAASMWFVPTVARAGGCPECETSADCPDGFCVFWDEGHGCASVNPICCPGQGCVVEDGRPSCEADGLCCVVEDPQCTMPPDTSSGSESGSSDGSADGSTDASGSESDGSSSSANDASATDASASDASASDSGGGTADGGDGGDGTDPTNDDDDEGCGCTSAARTDRLTWMLVGFAGMLATRRRRMVDARRDLRRS